MRCKHRKALAASEFALILPLLVTFILGCIDFGRFASRYIAVTSAAEAGARVGCLEPCTPANQAVWLAAIQAAVEQDLAGTSDFVATDLTLTVTTLGSPGDAWQVQVDVRYPFSVLIPWPGIPSQISLHQVVVLQTIRP